MAYDEKGRSHIKATDVVLPLTLTLDTSAYADGDVLADTQELAGVGQVHGETVVLQSIIVQDFADQGQGMQVVFLDADKDLGTENAAPNISDANSASIIGHVDVATTDYADFTGMQVATVSNIGLALKCHANDTSLYVGVLSDGTGTYGTADVRLLLGFLR